MELNQEIYKKSKKCPYIYKIFMEKEIKGKASYNNYLELGFCSLSNDYEEDRFSIRFSNVQNLKIKNLQ